MKKICIYVTYSKENIINQHVGYMLKAFNECGIDTYLVCNYPEIINGRRYAELFVKDIFCRPNQGYDVGAYRDVMCKFIGWEKLDEYDELFLVNDSFWGPIFPFKDCLDKMSDVSCDYWGMTRSMPGELEEASYIYEEHIQSYFLVFRKEVLQSRAFRQYWEQLEMPKTYEEAIIKFELALNSRLSHNGFYGKAITDEYGKQFKQNENPYLLYSYEIIKECHIPLLKKKSLSINNPGFPNALQALVYIEKYTTYPVNWIKEALDNQFYVKETYLDMNKNLEEFYYRYQQIYIYGMGVCGKNLEAYFAYKKWTFSNFVVTNKLTTDSKIKTIDEIPITSSTGIIISVINQRIADEIKEKIGNRCNGEQVFFVSRCKGIS